MSSATARWTDREETALVDDLARRFGADEWLHLAVATGQPTGFDVALDLLRHDPRSHPPLPPHERRELLRLAIDQERRRRLAPTDGAVRSYGARPQRDRQLNLFGSHEHQPGSWMPTLSASSWKPHSESCRCPRCQEPPE